MAKSCTEKDIKEALKKGRTIGYTANNLMGEQSLLEKFINSAINCRITSENKEKQQTTYTLTNNCSVPFILRRGNSIYDLKPFTSLNFTLGVDSKTGKYKLPTFTIDNMWHADEQHPTIEISVDK